MKERKDGRREGRGSREGGEERWIDGGEGRDLGRYEKGKGRKKGMEGEEME